jgi:hypothetical protein
MAGEMGGIYSTHGNDKYIQYFDQKFSKEEIIWET